MNIKEPQIGTALNESIGKGEKLTSVQLWALVKFARHARKYCRSNAALYNSLARMFPYATFREVPKGPEGEKYMGLEITVKE